MCLGHSGWLPHYVHHPLSVAFLLKPDHCPPDTEQDVKNFNYCNKDDDCKGKQKCCFAFWGSECLDTQKGKVFCITVQCLGLLCFSMVNSYWS
uniref:WAP domain-containing protein n=1 Tax=Podarcis muralis TaxID=64176 RepID=A0A670IMQ1_PODMU